MLEKKMFSCIGGCKRKTLGEKKKGGSCLEGLWSCMRCLMSQKNRYEEKEQTEQEPTDSLLELIWDLQSRRINDQRCSFNSASKTKVQNTEQAVAVSTPGAEEDDVGEVLNRCASDDTYKTANESSDEEHFVDCVNDQKLSQRSSKNPSLRSSERAPSNGNPSSALTSQGNNTPALTSQGNNTPALTSQGNNTPALTSQGNNTPALTSQGNNTPALTSQGNNTPALTSQGNNTPALTSQGNNTPALTSQGNNTPALTSQGNDTPALTSQGDYENLKLDQLKHRATLGKGAYGRVELVTLETDPTLSFALKRIEKKQTVDNHEQKDVCEERRLMMATNSPFIARMYRTFKDDKYVYMLMEPCLGGELFGVLNNRKHVNNKTARFYAGCVVLALQYLHGIGIVYRDIKLENLVMDSRGYLKLVDFGMAKEIGKGKTWTLCGSPNYIAPEIILEHGYDHTADYWSLGVVAFVLLSGRYPFDGPSHYEIFEAILDGIKRTKFPRKIGKHAKGFITAMCNSNPAERLGSSQNMEIQQHRWFRGFDWDALYSQTMIPPIDPKVKGPTDCGNFSSISEIIPEPPDEMSGWDIDF